MEHNIQEQTIKDINSKIIEVTMLIEERYPELIMFLSELPVTIPDKQDPSITLKVLKEYHNTLETMLNDYITNYN